MTYFTFFLQFKFYKVALQAYMKGIYENSDVLLKNCAMTMDEIR